MTLLEKLESLKSKKAEVIELHNKLEQAKSAYKQECKSVLGIADGEPADVLELAFAMLTIAKS